MTPQEIAAECRAIAESFNPKADVSVRISNRGGPKPIGLICYPFGIGGTGDTIYVTAASFEEGFAELREQIVATRAAYDEKLVRRMVQVILENADDRGHVFESALRTVASAEEIERLAPLALEAVCDLLKRPSFTIVHDAREAAE